jgi:diguanylate cyclase (GGDEF)-like protein
MLNVPTLWTAFVVNFLALGMIWAYVIHSYPNFEAARYWTASAFTAVAGAGLATGHLVYDAPALLLAGGAAILFAICLATMGIKRFYDQPVRWLSTALIVGLTMAALIFFTYGYASAPMRVMVYSCAQSLPLALAAKLLFSPHDGRVSPGAQLAGTVAALVITVFALRTAGSLVGVDFTFTGSRPVQSVMVLALMFLSMAINFGFLLMAMDRLRNEVADLALLDDLTGVANRRQLVQRLSEECARSERSGEPFSLLVIDLDGFKSINDTFGHAAGDACLQHFTLMAQTRLRPGDLLARAGGDEFCIVLPSSTLREGAMIARRILEVCRQDAEACIGADVPIAVSIGVAQWTRETGPFPDRLIAAADQALYVAKKEGKGRYAISGASPPLAPEPEPMPTPVPVLRQQPA